MCTTWRMGGSVAEFSECRIKFSDLALVNFNTPMTSNFLRPLKLVLGSKDRSDCSILENLLQCYIAKD